MAYATVEQFVACVTELEARAMAPSTPAGTYDAVLIGEKLADASAEADSYTQARYGAPLSPVPKLITDAVIAIARAALDRQGRQLVKDDAARVRAWLKDVARGTASLGLTESGAPAPEPTAGGEAVQMVAPERVFRRGID